MGYNKELDKTIDEEICDFGNTKVHVALNQYDGGPKKIGLSRENEKDGVWTFSKLGRLTIKEAEKVVEGMAEMLKAAEGNGEEPQKEIKEETVEDDMF